MNFRKHAVVLAFLTSLVTACAKSEKPASNPPLNAEAIKANNHAVGLMGKFEYAEAQEQFRKLVKQWPAWLDVKVNLAIATLNRQGDGDERAALKLVEEVLQTDASHLRAHYFAGLIRLYVGEPAVAQQHFEFVARNDSGDAYAAYYLAQCRAQQGDYEQSLLGYQRSIAADPYLRSAYYGAFQSLQRLQRPQQAQALAADYQRLENNPRSRLAEFKYTRMGPKAAAMAIDLVPDANSIAPQGDLYTVPTLLPIESASPLDWQVGQPEQTPSFTTVDLQGDGFADLFIADVLGLEDGTGKTVIGNLVLLGQSDGSYQARTDHPLARVADVNAALWGDFDNDGLVDVYFCRRGENRLWRQVSPDQWSDITATAGVGGGDLDTVDGAFFDADHDGDLDLFLVNADGPNELLNNNLNGSFRPLAAEYGLSGGDAASTMVVPVDLDNDRDTDLIVLSAQTPHQVFINDRLWSYHPAEGYQQFNNSPALTALAADMDADGSTELYTVAPAGELFRWQADPDGQLRPQSLGTPELLKSASGPTLAGFDVNGDGSQELIVSSNRGWAAFSLGADALEPLYEVTAPAPTRYAASLSYLGDSLVGPAMLALPADGDGVMAWAPGPGRYPFVTLKLSGRQDNSKSMRSNVSGIGTQLAVRTGSRWSRLQNFRNHSAPGQSLQPLAVGLNGARRADFLSLDWSDGVFQSEVNVATGRLQEIVETQRQLSSCPVLFAWDGQAYRFVSDILGVGGLGYATGPGEYARPRPWENFLFPEGFLQAREGRIVLKISEPMEEIAYLDAARLVTYDLPPAWRMVLDERMGISGPEPTGEPRFYQQEMLPCSAINERGDEVLEALLANDGVAAPVGERDSRFIGRLQNEHLLELEFSQPLDSLEGEAMLVIDGWVEYPYSQTNFAAWQADAEFAAPSLDAATPDGQWQLIIEQFGYPAGMPRRMSVPLPSLPKGTQKLRLRTNMQVYWDRVAVAYAKPLPEHRAQLMPLAAATLRKAGFAKRSTLDQFRPHYDYANLSPFWDTRYMAGMYTALGSVNELVNAIDDAVAIIGPGEEVHLEFVVPQPAPPGWSRFFVLESNGWAKDMDLYTRDGDTVGPLPGTGKPERIRDALHERYNTRYQAGF